MTPPLSSYIPWACFRSPAASVVVCDPSDASYIPRVLQTPLSLSLSPQARFPLPTPPLTLSIPWARKHTATSIIGDVHSGASSLLLPPPTPLLSLSSPWSYLSMPKPQLLSSITQAYHRDATASVVVPESFSPLSSSPIPRTRRLFLVLLQRLCRCCQFRGPVSMTPPNQS